MSNREAVDVSDTDDPSDIPRLTGYARSAQAEQDIRDLSPLEGAELVDAFRETNDKASDYRQTEAVLAYLRRAIVRKNKREIAGLNDLLTKRCQGYFASAMRGVRNVEERMDIQQQILADISAALTQGRREDEYLQARFWRWLKLRTLRRITEAKAARVKHPLADDYTVEGEDDHSSRVDDVASSEMSAEDRLLLMEGLAQLPDDLRTLYVMRYLEGWEVGNDRNPTSDPNDPTLAEYFGITARAINKRLAKAEKLLASYRKDPA